VPDYPPLHTETVRGARCLDYVETRHRLDLGIATIAACVALVALVGLVAWRAYRGHEPACARFPELPPGPTVDLLPAATSTLPQVRKDHVRIDRYDVDVETRANMKVDDVLSHVLLRWPGCSVVLTASPYEHDRVGTLPLGCRLSSPSDSPECLAICQTIEPIAGSTATELYPTDEPVISVGLYGGFFGHDDGASVWADGTVQFHGPGCAKWRSRRGKLAPERVASLVDALDRGGVFEYQDPGESFCSDAFEVSVIARAGNRRAVVDEADCGELRGHGLPFAAYVFVWSVLGPNPCKDPR
jgi:hypothetical protein